MASRDIEHFLRTEDFLSFYTFFKRFTYLFAYLGAVVGLSCCTGISLVAGLGYSCSVWAFHCGGFSCCGAQVLGLAGSVAVAHGL